MKNLVSIITPSFNSSAFIKDTIDSVLSQTYTNWEMIIVDDNSIDDSYNYIKNIIKDESRIQVILLSKNKGAANARNEALKIANGRFIAFLDSDDVWLPTKLESQLKFMEVNKYAFTFTAYSTINEEGDKELSIINVPKEIGYIEYCKNTIIGCLTVVIDKNQIGEFQMPNIRSSHDMALWLLIMKRGYSAYGLNIVTAKYRIVSTSNTSRKFKAAFDVWRVYREVEKLSLLRSYWYFSHYVANAILKRL